MTAYIFKIITLLGGLALFLFGMDVMGKALERQAGGKLQTILAKMSSNVFKGFLLGLGVTAVIQSSSATTVMVVGFVNSGIMTLKQAVGDYGFQHWYHRNCLDSVPVRSGRRQFYHQAVQAFHPGTSDRYYRHRPVHGQE